jgi:hypothetical protein
MQIVFHESFFWIVESPAPRKPCIFFRRVAQKAIRPVAEVLQRDNLPRRSFR